MESPSVRDGASLSDWQVSNLNTKKVFFGHQSVGVNIMQGIKDIMAGDPRLKLNIAQSTDPQFVAGPAFVESQLGENGNPKSKTKAFADILAKGLGTQGGIAMYKYCYADIGHSTNVRQMFDSYRAGATALKQSYPLLRIIHVTVPLTTAEPAVKALVKSLFGRTTAREENAKRNEFNKLLRDAYTHTEPIFDLAEVESTHADGSRSYFVRANERVYTLAPEFTTDGGHLNDAGRRAAAERLLLVISNL